MQTFFTTLNWKKDFVSFQSPRAFPNNENFTFFYISNEYVYNGNKINTDMKDDVL